jgi:FlaG/FlaF family flagellin (archaellin)
MGENIGFLEDGEAVSAVIGVILMVAITVAIASMIYVYVKGAGDETTIAPIIIFTPDNNNAKLTVSTATANTPWADVNVTITDGTNTGYYEGTGYVTGGDEIVINTHCPLCSGDVTVTVVHTPSNTLLGTWTFTS